MVTSTPSVGVSVAGVGRVECVRDVGAWSLWHLRLDRWADPAVVMELLVTVPGEAVLPGAALVLEISGRHYGDDDPVRGLPRWAEECWTVPLEAPAGEVALLLNMVPEWAADAAELITWIVGLVRPGDGDGTLDGERESRV